MTASKNKSRRRPALEALEDRLAPAVTVSVTPTHGLRIVSDGASDKVVVAEVGAYYRVTNFGAPVASLPAAGITAGALDFLGNGGNDFFRNDTALRAFAGGGTGHDTLIGGWGNDDLWGSGGDDVLRGRGGNDIMHGHQGRDIFYGGSGYDYAHGGLDADWAAFDVESLESASHLLLHHLARMRLNRAAT